MVRRSNLRISFFFFSSRRRHTRYWRDWSSDVCSSDLTPYNFPLTLLGTKVAPALVSGNTVVAKPAATTPLAILEVARLFAEAGVPDGVLNVVTGRGSTIGDRLVGHPDVRRVAFTGSTPVGRHIAGLAGPQLKRVSVELGG